MNRNPDGSLLTREQHVAFAVKGGMDKAKVTRDTYTHVFEREGRHVRHSMFWAGLLELDTRPVERPAKSMKVDWEVVNFLTGKG